MRTSKQGNDPLSHRAADRLQTLLTDLNFSLDPILRVKALAAALAVTEDTASNLLSGRFQWSLADVNIVSRSFSKEPSHFLDSASTAQMPGDSVVVTSADGGENIVWRAPTGFLNVLVKNDAKFKYVTAIGTGFFTARPIQTLLIFEEWSSWPRSHEAVVPETGYILEIEQGRFTPYWCIAKTSKTAIFAPQVATVGKSEAVTLNLSTTALQLVVGRVIGSVQAI